MTVRGAGRAHASRRRRTARRAAVATSLLALAVCAGVAPSARGALPPDFGGRLRLPAPGELRPPDPTDTLTPFEAALCAATFDTLYESDARGQVVPVLASAAPEVAGRTVRIRLREGVLRHDRLVLTAEDVVASLRRAARRPQARWLLEGFAREEGELAARAADASTVELTLARAGVDVDQILGALPLAIVVGRHRALGTGPFSARAAPGRLTLLEHRDAARGAPYLAEVRFTRAIDRESELRAFELGRLDASWHGQSVYGRPREGVASTELFAAHPVLLVPNREGPLRAQGVLAALRRALDRRRLATAGLRPAAALSPGLAEPSLGADAASGARPPLRLLVSSDDPLEERLADALAGVLDDAGFELTVTRVDATRHEQAIVDGRWDLRFATVMPPLPGRTALVAAAFAAAGQESLARELVLAPNLVDPTPGTRAAPRLAAFVLGRRYDTLHHVDRLGALRYDAVGRLDLAALHLRRPPLGPGLTSP